MKRTLATLALVAAAGTAGAQTVQTQASGQPVQVPIGSTMNTGNSATTMPPGAGAPVGTTVTTNSNAGMRGAQMNSGAQINSNTQMNSGQMNSTMSASGSAGASSNANMANAPAPRLTGAAGTAQRRIEMDGYKNVQNLQRGADGLWQGTAMRGNAQVQVIVDRAGRVSAQ